MKPLPHHYAVRLTGGPAGYAQLAAENRPVLRAAPPVEYDGPGDAWSPEHLLLAAIQSCFLFTFRAVARLSRVEFLGLEVEAEGTVDRADGLTRFTDIVLRPTLTIPGGGDHGRATEALQRTARACLVSASLASPVRVEPQVVEEEEELRKFVYM
jgi:organic hydroperoxide reductase OsmC/OhrA